MPTQEKTEKVHLSFSNWVLGGSLVSVTSTKSAPRRASRKVVLIEVDSDGNEASPKKHKAENKKDDDADKKIDGSESQKKDGEGRGDKEKEKHKHTCCKHHKSNEGEFEKADDSENSKADGSKKDDSHKPTDNGGWTEAQDKTIWEMKAANKSWKEIALEVGASKKDVIERFKALQKEGNREGDSSNEGGKTNGGSGGGGGGGENNDGGFGDFGGLFGGDDDEGGGNSNGNQNQNQSWGNNNDHSHGGGKKDKVSKQQQQNQREADQNQRGSKKGGSPGQSHEEKSKGRLEADHIWNREDCEILEYLEAKYEEHKWLHMQAGFFNWTGRMVIAELIEKKFKDDGAA